MSFDKNLSSKIDFYFQTYITTNEESFRHDNLLRFGAKIKCLKFESIRFRKNQFID